MWFYSWTESKIRTVSLYDNYDSMCCKATSKRKQNITSMLGALQTIHQNMIDSERVFVWCWTLRKHVENTFRDRNVNHLQLLRKIILKSQFLANESMWELLLSVNCLKLNTNILCEIIFVYWIQRNRNILDVPLFMLLIQFPIKQKLYKYGGAKGIS